MEGSIFSILPLLFLIILGLPAMIPNFTGKLQFVGEKSVWIWGLLARKYRQGVTLLDFLFSTPVVQLPVLMVGGSGTANYLAIWGINEIEVRTAKALPLPISSRISLTPVSACGVPMQNEFKLPLIVATSMFKA